MPRRNSRAASAVIYYFPRHREVSHWHRVDAAEPWHWYSGGFLQPSLSHDGKSVEELAMGSLLAANQHPALVVSRHVWQRARTLGDYTVAGYTVAPGFEIATLEMAPLE